MVCAGTEQLQIQIVKPLEGSTTCIININVSGTTESSSFTGAIDLETGLVGAGT